MLENIPFSKITFVGSGSRITYQKYLLFIDLVYVFSSKDIEFIIEAKEYISPGKVCLHRCYKIADGRQTWTSSNPASSKIRRMCSVD